MRVTIKDIAREAGISKTTVSLYLNRHRLSEHIAAATKRKIDEAIAALNYKPSATARALSRGKTNTLGLVVGGIANEYFSHFSEAVLEAASKRGYQVLISVTRWDRNEERRCLENLMAQQVDGILYYPRLTDEALSVKPLLHEDVPVVLLDQYSSLYSTINNDFQTAFRAAIHKLRLRGHEKIYGLFGLHDYWLENFKEACKQTNTTFEILPDQLTYAAQRKQAVKRLSEIRVPNIITNGRQTTRLLLKSIDSHALDYCPDIISGYDTYCEFSNHNCIAGIILCHSGKLVCAAIDTLLDQIENKRNPSPVHIAIPAEFIPENVFANDEDSDICWETDYSVPDQQDKHSLEKREIG